MLVSRWFVGGVVSYLLCPLDGFIKSVAALPGLRFLAYQPQFFLDPRGTIARDYVDSLRLVPLGGAGHGVSAR